MVNVKLDIFVISVTTLSKFKKSGIFMQKIYAQLEKIFVVLSLFFSTSALIPVLLETEQDSSMPPDPYSPVLFTGIYLITLILIAKYRQTFVRVAQKDIWIWLLLVIVIASIFWTVEPDITKRRSILLVGTTLFGIYLAMRYNMRQQLELLAWTFGLIIVLSCLFAIFLPDYGVMSFQEGGVHAGAWRGVMTHKNILGRIMVLSSMIFFFVALSKSITHPIYRWLPWIFYILSIVLIVLSTSKSSLIVFLVLTAIFPLYRTWRYRYNYLIPLMIVFILVVGGTAILLFDNLDIIASELGRDLTLTGRTDVWAVMLKLIIQRPLFGYGFNAVWTGWDNDVTAYMWRRLQWECPYGHNGFMDLLIELGISGLAIFLLSYITTYIKAVIWLRSTDFVEGVAPLIYLSFLVIYNISESTLLATNSIFWILYVSTVFSVAIEKEKVKMYNYATAAINQEWIEANATKN